MFLLAEKFLDPMWQDVGTVVNFFLNMVTLFLVMLVAKIVYQKKASDKEYQKLSLGYSNSALQKAKDLEQEQSSRDGVKSRRPDLPDDLPGPAVSCG